MFYKQKILAIVLLTKQVSLAQPYLMFDVSPSSGGVGNAKRLNARQKQVSNATTIGQVIEVGRKNVNQNIAKLIKAVGVPKHSYHLFVLSHCHLFHI
jgi:hypothetical protein